MFLALNPATDRNTNAHWVECFGVKVLFSYQTAVAFNGEKYARRHNDWGPTTGRHLRECQVDQWPEIADEAEFNAALDQELMRALSNKVAAALEPRRAFA